MTQLFLLLFATELIGIKLFIRFPSQQWNIVFWSLETIQHSYWIIWCSKVWVWIGWSHTRQIRAIHSFQSHVMIYSNLYCNLNISAILLLVPNSCRMCFIRGQYWNGNLKIVLENEARQRKLNERIYSVHIQEGGGKNKVYLVWSGGEKL